MALVLQTAPPNRAVRYDPFHTHNPVKLFLNFFVGGKPDLQSRKIRPFDREVMSFVKAKALDVVICVADLVKLVSCFERFTKYAWRDTRW